MSLPTVDIIMTLKQDVEISKVNREVLNLLITEWLPEFFLPFEVQGHWGKKQIKLKAYEHLKSWKGIDLWQGEVVEKKFPLSRIIRKQGIHKNFLNELDQEHDDTFQFSFSGALYHEPYLKGSQIDWYGRLVVRESNSEDGRLWHIARTTFEWTEYERAVWVSFPFAGYPLTSHDPRIKPGSQIQATDLKESVKRNRQFLIPAIANVRHLLALTSSVVSWTIEYDEALLPEDRADLKLWETKLNQGKY